MTDFAFYLGVGFLAQLIDGTLGMAYGLSASSLLLTYGLPPATVSATVHAAEVFTTGFSAVSHHYFGNIDAPLFRRLVIPGMIGAAAGAYLLTSVPGEQFRPLVAVYLLVMGVVIIVRAFRAVVLRPLRSHVASLGLFGAFVDAAGGGGWGPIVASTLIARGSHVPSTVGTVNAAEFFVTLTASVVFVVTLGLGHWRTVAGLAAGGALAAPIAAWACRRIPHRPFLVMVGVLVILLSGRTLLMALR
jgi:hypothetical protein